ncbi:MAG: 50S ribosomal protein L3 [Verrucomicrobia bacterium 21-51-4]|nr:MAG: 50S ribosomal protein L3 [Verrucomicrobia bacterium 21-51-4]HQU08930.1 50S ribosomal protein L3 [Opitutales bacterium]
MTQILLGKKLGMTQIYDAEGRMVPVTVVEAGPCPVVQVRTKDTDGYSAVQIGFATQKESRMTAATLGHLKKAGVEPVRHLREFRMEEDHSMKAGDVLNVNLFAEGEKVDVIGTTKGRGFQGGVKRWGWAGGPASHGSMFHRQGGAYGMRHDPGMMLKGRHMPGHMGCDRRTMQNLRIVRILEDKNLLLIEGSFPGGKGSLVVVRKGKKQQNKK